MGREWRIAEKEAIRHMMRGKTVQLESQKTLQQKQTSESLSASRITELDQLALSIEQLTNVPEPTPPLLPDSREDEIKIEEEFFKNDTIASYRL